MKFPSFVRLFGERWQRTSSRRRQSRGRRPSQSPKLGLESLEDRTLMSVLPPPTWTGAQDISGTRGNENSPSIAVNPLNPQQAVAVWIAHDPQLAAPIPQVYAEAAFTSNGGAS